MFNRDSGLIVALAVLAAAFGGWLQHESRLAHVPAGVQVANVGDIRPDLALKDLNGRERRLSDFHGRRVLINFWASWCVPCLAEMPALHRAQENFGEKGVIVLGIAMDDPDHVRAFLHGRSINYPILLGQLSPPSTSLRLGDTDEVLPYSVLLDEQGRVLAAQRGPLDAVQLGKWLQP